MIYAYAKLSRNDFGLFRVPISGVGLGNLLFAWARCIVFTRRYNLTPIWPTWAQIKLGPILRRETDKRFYHNLFLNPPGYISGLRKLRLLKQLRRISEDEFEQRLLNGIEPEEHLLVEFEGMQGYFSKMLNDHQTVYSELLRMTRSRHKLALPGPLTTAIAVHVRLGDFAVSSVPVGQRKGAANFRIPISWYVEKIKQVREVIGQEIPVWVFSDGKDAELDCLLLLSGVKRMSFGSSIADLLAMARSSILIASGSTFSMWASYLGRMSVIWYPGEMRQRLYYEPDLFEVESGEGDDLPTEFLRTVMAMHQGSQQGC